MRNQGQYFIQYIITDVTLNSDVYYRGHIWVGDVEIEIHPIAVDYMGLEFRGEIWAGETYLEGFIHSFIHSCTEQMFLEHTLCAKHYAGRWAIPSLSHETLV